MLVLMGERNQARIPVERLRGPCPHSSPPEKTDRQVRRTYREQRP